MIQIDENKLKCGTIAMIGEDLGYYYNYNEFIEEDYDNYIKMIVNKLKMK